MLKEIFGVFVFFVIIIVVTNILARRTPTIKESEKRSKKKKRSILYENKLKSSCNFLLFHPVCVGVCGVNSKQ